MRWDEDHFRSGYDAFRRQIVILKTRFGVDADQVARRATDQHVAVRGPHVVDRSTDGRSSP